MRFCIVILLCAFLPVSSIQAGGFGRLFYTPEQRAQLEHNFARIPAVDDAPPIVLTVNGIVQCSGGARTVWINGAAQNSVQGSEPAAEVIAVPGKAQAIKIKVGQKLLLDPPPIAPVLAE